MDLTKLTDKQLIELQKQILEEKENRKDSLLYKSNISFTEEQYKEMSQYMNSIFKSKGFLNVKTEIMLNSPMIKIQDAMYVICDFIYGNFKYPIDKNSGGRRKIVRNASRLLIDDKEDYRDMYMDLYSVIEKHMKKRQKKREVE